MNNFFYPIGDTIRDNVNHFIDYLVVNYADGFEAVSNQLLFVLVNIEKGLGSIPPWLFILALSIITYAASRRVWLSLTLAFCMYFIGCLGLWDQAIQTIAIIIISILLSTIIGLPVGVFSAKNNTFRAVLSPVLDLMQTIPSFVYLIPAAMLFGLGKVPAIFATFIYATPPLIRLVDLGIRGVNKEVVEASKSFGASQWQILSGIQIPLALPSIMQGINQTMMMALAMVVVASMIGARGLGETVLFGLQRNDSGTGLLGGIAIVILAIIFDRITQSAAAQTQKYQQAINK